MRILQFAPGPYRNLPDSPLYFTLDAETKPDNDCSIRFLVGLNGTGKTNILRYLTSIFLALDEDFRRPRDDSPAYNLPFGLAYQMRGDTIIIRSDGLGRSGVEFTINGEKRNRGDLPAKARIMPRTLLVYTSGNVEEWQSLINPAWNREDDESDQEIQLDELRVDDELSVEDRVEEAGESMQSGDRAAFDAEADAEIGETASLSSSRVVLVEPEQMHLALLAALLEYQMPGKAQEEYKSAFRDVLDQIRVKLVGFSLLIDPDMFPIVPQHQRLLRQLYELATLPLQQWNDHLLVFDLDQIDVASGSSTLEGLCNGPAGDAFDFFQFLVELYKRGALRGANLVLNYTPQDAKESEAVTLLASGLSDGEFAFVARMALIYLLHEDECLFLLDEPETHFNDEWKRNLVDSIERALVGTNSEVILTSHASVTLTDAYPSEVILLTPAGQEAVPLTLATEPGELLLRLFGAERSVGKRAQRRIDAALTQGDEAELRDLLDQVGVGYYRFKIVEELNKGVSSTESS